MNNERDSIPDQIRLLQSEVTIWKDRWEGLRVLFKEVADALGCDVKNNEAMLSEIQRLQQAGNANEELREAVEGFLQILDEYHDPLVPIKRSATIVRFMRNALAVAPKSSGGLIPVSEKFPEIRKGFLDVTVLIAHDGEPECSEALYCSDGNFRWGRDEDPIENVTHWMPRPAAPHQEGV